MRNNKSLERFLLYAMIFSCLLLAWLLRSRIVILIPLIVFGAAAIILGLKNWKLHSHPVAMKDNNDGAKYIQAHEWDKAIECFNRAISNYPEFAWAYQNRGIAWLNKNKLDRAIRDFDEAIRLEPKSAQSYYDRAVAFFQKGDHDKALADCDQASALSDAPSPVDLLRGRILLAQNRNAEAISVLKFVAEESNRSSVAYNELASAYERVRNDALALENYNIAVEIDPRNALLYNNRGYLYSRLGKVAEALADCNRAVSLNPKNEYVLATRGQVYFQMENYLDALNNFDRSIKLKPDHKFAIVGQALCQNALGNKKEAMELWSTLIFLDSQYNTVDKFIEEYHPAPEFVEAAKKLVTDFNKVGQVANASKGE